MSLIIVVLFCALLLGLFLAGIAFFKLSRGLSVLMLAAIAIAFAQTNISDISEIRKRDVLALKAYDQAAGGVQELWISHLLVDGKKHDVKSSLTGTWFFWKNRLGWVERAHKRLETPQIEIAVPTGLKRQIVFETAFSGKIELSLYNKLDTISFDSSADKKYTVDLPATDIKYLQKKQIQALLMACGIMAAKTFAIFLLAMLYLAHRQRIDVFVTRHWPVISIALIALSELLVLLNHAGAKSLWIDELTQLHNSHADRGGLIASLKSFAQSDYSPPLSTVITYFWLKIAPYGTFWLKLPSVIFLTVGTFIMGLTGKRLLGSMGGIVCALLCTCWVMLIDTGMQLRPYGLFFMSIALTFYFFTLLHTDAWKPGPVSRIAYTASLVLLSYSHYFGVLIIVGLFIAESIRLYLRKEKPYWIIPYVISALIFMPWIVFNFSWFVAQDAYWAAKPTLDHQRNIFRLVMLNGNPFSLVSYGLAIGAAVALAHFVTPTKGKEHNCLTDKHFIIMAFICVILFSWSSIYIFSTKIKPGISLFADRYLISLLPAVILIATFGFTWFHEKLTKNNNKFLSNTIFLLVFMFCVVIPDGTRVIKQIQGPINPKHNFEGVADWLMQQIDIDNPDVLVIYNCRGTWLNLHSYTYYMTHNGQFSDIKVFRIFQDAEPPKSMDNFNKIYLIEAHGPIDIKNNSIGKIIMNKFKKRAFHKNINLTVYERL